MFYYPYYYDFYFRAPIYNTFYEHINGGGRFLELLSGERKEYVGNDFNDKISSVSVAPYSVVILFENRGFRGQKGVLRNETAFPQLFNIHNIGAWNDEVSSIITYGVDLDPPPGSYRPTNTFHEHINETGANYSLISGMKQEYVGDWWNDKISSVTVAPRTLVLLYEDRGFKGRIRYLENFNIHTNITYNIHDQDWNDKVSSIITYRMG